jgi:acyl-CoA thioester hydrolase
MTTVPVPELPLAVIAAGIDAIDYGALGVRPEYIDPNGHMNVGYYGVLFDRALDLVWDRLGIGYGQIAQTGKSSFSLESHLTYQREVKLGDPIHFDFLMLDHDAKRVQYFLTMRHADGTVAATQEQLSVCVDMATRRSSVWPEAALERIAALHAAHRARPRPAEAGRPMAIRRK